MAIVGAGMGGISAGVLLRKAGITTFTIYEKSERVGGTWWDNQYPGAEVDVDSYIYSFPFKRYDWTRTHARQPEIHRYLEETVRDFDLRPHLRLGVGVQRAVWDEDRHAYDLTLTNGEAAECDVLISAVGFLNVPYYPDWPGLDDFHGPTFHTSRWEHQHDLTGKTVAIVGTGSTASQLVPALQPEVGKILLFQREPGWVLPKGDRDYTTEERARLHNPRRAPLPPVEVVLGDGEAPLQRRGVPSGHAHAHRGGAGSARLHREDVRRSSRPRGGGDAELPVLGQAHHLQLRLLSRAQAAERGARAPGGRVDHRPRGGRRRRRGTRGRRARPLDRVPAHELPRPLGSRRSHGRQPPEVLGRRAAAFLGVTVPTFPNFFMLYGPGTNGGEIALNLRNQAAYALRAVKRMVREGVTAIEVKRSWADPYHAWLMAQMEGTAWAVSNNYFTTTTGKIVTQWPFSALDYGALLKTLGRPSETARRRGAPTEDVTVDEATDDEVLHDAEADEPLQYQRW